MNLRCFVKSVWREKNRFRQPENTKRVNQFRWRGQRQLHAIHIEIIGKTQFRQPENNRSDGQNRAPYQQHSPIFAAPHWTIADRFLNGAIMPIFANLCSTPMN